MKHIQVAWYMNPNKISKAIVEHDYSFQFVRSTQKKAATQLLPD